MIHFHATHLIALAITIPPAVKTLAVLAFIYGIIQILKQSSVLARYINITGGWAMALNAILSALGLLVVIPPARLYDPTTLGVTFTTWLGIVLGAAGIHGTVKSLSDPTVLAVMPGTTVAMNVPAILVPLNPAAKAVTTKVVVLFALGLTLGLAAGCTAPVAANPATLAPAIKVAAAIDQVASSIAAAQQIEISLHEQGVIDLPTHIAIEKGFLKVGADGAAITKGVNDGITASSMQALVGVLTTDLQADVSSGALGIKNPASQATFTASIAGIGVAVELITQSYAPPTAAAKP